MQEEVPKSFIEHIEELRKLVMQPFLVMILVAGIAFWKSHFFIALLQKPLNKTLYYSSPIGGFSFILQVAVVCGLLASLPLFVRSIIKFLEPVMAKVTKKLLHVYLLSSILLAAIGVFCGYVISLPAALRFLNGFESGDLKPLISANEYLSFTLIYLAGFAILFQLPLIMTIINRIKPLKPRRLMHHQRLVILGSFIVAAILTPTPDIVNQLIFAAPMIMLYQISIALIWLINRKSQPAAAKTKHKALIDLTPESEPSFSHPVGAVYAPQPVTVDVSTRLRPIDVIMSNSSFVPS